MTTLTRPSMNTKGFTLIELLVVIAIISILATIAVPSIIQFLLKGNNAKAISEINNTDTVLISMLTDARKQNFLHFLDDGSRAAVLAELDFIYDPLNPDGFSSAAFLQESFDIMFYELLRRGKEADLTQTGWNLDPQVRSKLGTSYFEELGNDPWGERYHFWLGPIRKRWPQLIRSYRTDGVNSFDYSPLPYMFDQSQRDFEQNLLPGQPNVDKYVGYPAPRGKPVYIWSAGANLRTDSILAISFASGIYQDFEFAGGGDDINNWDSARGWEDAPEA